MKEETIEQQEKDLNEIEKVGNLKCPECGIWYSKCVTLTDFIKAKLHTQEQEYKKELVEEIINELESNPNEDGSISPNIQHWIEHKQTQLRKIINQLTIK